MHCDDTSLLSFFFFNDTATTEIYTLSLHDALPICPRKPRKRRRARTANQPMPISLRCRPAREAIRKPPHQRKFSPSPSRGRSEEHTSELQSPCNLVCRLLLEKKKKRQTTDLMRHSV